VPEQAEEFLRAHSATASVPSAPLALAQASAAALDPPLDPPDAAAAAQHSAAGQPGEEGARGSQPEPAESSALPGMKENPPWHPALNVVQISAGQG
jgi:hypothetical protein